MTTYPAKLTHHQFSIGGLDNSFILKNWHYITENSGIGEKLMPLLP